MKKRTVVMTLFIFFLLSTAVQASWMGVTWLWVHVEKTKSHQSGSRYRTATLRVLRWGKGGGHGDQFGRRFPGRVVTVKLRFATANDAANLYAGETCWVKHFSASSKTWGGRRRSSRTWSYLGDTVRVDSANLSAARPPSSPRVTLLWAVRKGSKIWVKVKYKTFGSYDVKFTLYKQANRLHLVYVVANSRFTNLRKYDQKLFQIDTKKFSGKNISLFSGGKRLVRFGL